MATKNVQLKNGGGDLLMPKTDSSNIQMPKNQSLKYSNYNLSLPNGATYLTNNLGFEVGKSYRIRLEETSKQASGKSLGIYLVPNASSSSGNKWIGGIQGVYNYADFIYTPQAASNYQYFYFWQNDSAKKATLFVWELADSNLKNANDFINDEINLEKILPTYNVVNPQKIDLDSLPLQQAALGGNNKWTYNSTYGYGKHKAIPVIAGEKYVIKCNNSMTNVWAWVSSAYSPPYANNSTVPYVSGCTRIYGRDAVIEEAPVGAAYLIICVSNGSGNGSEWEVYKVDSFKVKPLGLMTKFKFASWNIGRFVYTNYKTTHTTSDISDADADAYALEFRKIIDKTGANIIGICEYDTHYPRHSSSGSTRDIIFKSYKRAQIGTYIQASSCNAIFYNSPYYMSYIEKIFDHTVKNDIDPSAAQRYYIDLICLINGIEVHIIETHLDWTDDDIRTLQIAELVTATSSYSHVIIGGDFNTDGSTVVTEMQPFVDAGFEVANGGNIGSFVTHEDGYKLDNIVAKGFTMSNIKVDEYAGNLSDHWIISCDLEMV